MDVQCLLVDISHTLGVAFKCVLENFDSIKSMGLSYPCIVLMQIFWSREKWYTESVDLSSVTIKKSH